MGQCQSLPKGSCRRGPQGKPAQQGSPPIPVEQQNRLGDSGESMKTVRRHMSAGQKTKSDLGAEMPVEQRYGPVEHFVVTNGVWRRIPVEQKYRPAEHGSKPIPVYDARDYGDDLDEILPRTPLSDAVIGPRRRYPW